MSKEALRAKFEAWYEADAMPCEADWFKRDHDVPDEYDSAHTHAAWKAWQAALSLLRAELEAGGEADGWQYRWTNPMGDPHRECERIWEPAKPRSGQTLEQRLNELRSYRYDRKPCYEVRALYASPVAADTQGDAKLREIAKLADALVNPPQMTTGYYQRKQREEDEAALRAALEDLK